MTEIPNHKKLAFDPPLVDMDIVYCDLEFICNLVLVVCYFQFIRAEFF